MTPPAEISARLHKELRLAFFEMDPAGLTEAAAWLDRGGDPWFLEELAAAIRTGALTPEAWEEITDIDDETPEEVENHLRQGWRIFAPERPFPLDA